jgi:hypothetical protein
MSKNFHIGDILSITTGRSLPPSYMDGIYKILSYMTGTKVYTLNLGKVTKVCKRALLIQMPWLSKITAKEMEEEEAQEWLEEITKEYGKYHLVEKLSGEERFIPESYRCSECGAYGIKLWREYSTFVPELKCASCAAKDQEIDISQMDCEGIFPRTDALGCTRLTDQIGWYVPAVPDKEGEGYWGYTSVPQEALEWWNKLPNRLE